LQELYFIWKQTHMKRGCLGRSTYDEHTPEGFDSVIITGGESDCGRAQENKKWLTLRGLEPSPFEGGGDDVVLKPLYRPTEVLVIASC
jgi:hypothetical protein